MTTGPLGIVLLTGTHERAHFAFSLAASAAALGREVVLFASGAGCRALLADWSALEESGRDARVRRRGVVGFGELRQAAADTGVRLLACDAGLRAEAIEAAALIDKVEVVGIATFLEAVGNGQMVSC